MKASHPRSTDICVDPTPRFELSPYLYMQFMEPLGVTDTSVEAGWDFKRNCWRPDLIAATRELAPSMIRWGGCFLSYYRWREAVGPRSDRVPIYNLCWDGIETNQVGTHEFIDFCRQVNAEPLVCVNLAGDGKVQWAKDPRGRRRTGSAREAAAWVDYCNSPDHPGRRAHGAKAPYNVRFWQLGNESSYGEQGVDCFDCTAAVHHTVAFAKAMRKKDPSIQVLAWGDSGWAPRMIEEAGDYFEYISFHHHFDSGLKHSPLTTNGYRHNPEKTWRHLMNAWKSTDRRLRAMRAETAGSGKYLALTESHFALRGRNRCEVLSSWAAGVANARILNVHERHGDVLKIATLADFCGNRWSVNALMIPTPYWNLPTYLMPVARVMELYRKHSGRQYCTTVHAPKTLDITASRTGTTVYLHVVNTDMKRSVRAALSVPDCEITAARVFEISDDPLREIDEFQPRLFTPVQKELDVPSNWKFPPASVSAVELKVRPL